MRARLATALSIFGVVATGGAAFAMNSSILDTSSTAQGSPALATVVSVDPVAGVPDAATVMPTADSPVAVISAGVVAESMTAIASPETPSDAKKRPESLRPLALAPETTGASVTSTPSTAASAVASVSQPIAPANPTTAPPTSVVPSSPVVRQFNVEDFASIFLAVSGGQLGIDRITLAPGSAYTVSNKYASGDTVRITLASAARTIAFSARLSNGEIVAAISDPTSALLPPPRRDDDDHDDDHDEGEHDDDDDHEEREHHDREDDDD